LRHHRQLSRIARAYDQGLQWEIDCALREWRNFAAPMQHIEGQPVRMTPPSGKREAAEQAQNASADVSHPFDRFP